MTTANKASGADASYSNAKLAILEWLGTYLGAPVPSRWVPGASIEERTRLAALGGLVRSLRERDTTSASEMPLIELGPDEVRQWMSWGPTPPNRVQDAGLKIMESKDEDGLAELYSSTVNPKSRRRLGTFFTPTVEVNWMLRRWAEVHPAPRSVIDVGAGVGAFTTAAAEQWPTTEVFAVDVNPVTLGLLALRLQNQGHPISDRFTEQGVRLVQEDYVTWASGHWNQMKGGRLVLGNPPYTRLQLLPLNERIALGEAAAPLCGSRASLSALITGATLNLLRPEDGLCLLLPAQWLEADYAIGLRRWLWESTNRRIDLHLFDSDLFADAQVDVVALVVGPDLGRLQPFVSSSSAHGGDDDAATNRTMRDRTHSAPSGWRAFFKAGTARKPTAQDRPLSAFGRVKRGVATGANTFFVVSEEVRRAWALPDHVLVPLLQRTIDYTADSVSAAAMEALDPSRRKYLLRLTTGQPTSQEAEAYLEYGRSIGADSGMLCQARPCWYDLDKEIHIPDVIIGPASKTSIRFLENAASAAITNNLYGLSWHAATSAFERTKILAWLRSAQGQRDLFSIARTQGGGLKKIEPRALNSLLLPPDSFLSDSVDEAR